MAMDLKKASTSQLLASYDEENAKVIVDLLLDPETPADIHINLIQKLVASRKGENFFSSMFTESVSFGACPECEHENHWLIPEQELNLLGFVTRERDPEVLEYTDSDSCSQWEEACKKKKVTV